eukprot:2354893-Prymnesium_polylepis.1
MATCCAVGACVQSTNSDHTGTAAAACYQLPLPPPATNYRCRRHCRSRRHCCRCRCYRCCG